MKQQILDIIDKYVEAAGRADYKTLESLHFKDDPNFSEIEDFIPRPFGKETFEDIMKWIEKNGEPGSLMLSYEETKVYQLSETVCYTTSVVRQRNKEAEQFVRATLIFIKKGDKWGIIHGHWSIMPVGD